MKVLSYKVMQNRVDGTTMIEIVVRDRSIAELNKLNKKLLDILGVEAEQISPNTLEENN